MAESVRTLNPGYFALVMATGIVSIAMRNHDVIALSVMLLWIACASYAVLVVLNGWRLIAFPTDVAADLADPRRAFGLFTFVAATDVVGTRWAAGGHDRRSRRRDRADGERRAARAGVACGVLLVRRRVPVRGACSCTRCGRRI